MLPFHSRQTWNAIYVISPIWHTSPTSTDTTSQYCTGVATGIWTVLYLLSRVTGLIRHYHTHTTRSHNIFIDISYNQQVSYSYAPCIFTEFGLREMRRLSWDLWINTRIYLYYTIHTDGSCCVGSYGHTTEPRLVIPCSASAIHDSPKSYLNILVAYLHLDVWQFLMK